MIVAVSSFLLFAIGAIVPVLPYAFTDGAAAVAIAVIASGAGLFLLGAAATIITGHSAPQSGMRQLLIGWAAAAVTYGLGAAIGDAGVGRARTGEHGVKAIVQDTYRGPEVLGCRCRGSPHCTCCATSPPSSRASSC